MPLTITIPGRDLYDQKNERFVTIKERTITLEHSLLSLSKWEAKWHKAYLSPLVQKSEEESLDYIRCMCLSQNIDPDIFYGLTQENVKQIADYIADPMTGTTFHNQNQKKSREIVTNELIYYWMTECNIPFDPCQKWHLNHLMTLIDVCFLKQQPGKKMSKRDILKQNAALNAQRRARLGTKG